MFVSDSGSRRDEPNQGGSYQVGQMYRQARGSASALGLRGMAEKAEGKVDGKGRAKTGVVGGGGMGREVGRGRRAIGELDPISELESLDRGLEGAAVETLVKFIIDGVAVHSDLTDLPDGVLQHQLLFQPGIISHVLVPHLQRLLYFRRSCSDLKISLNIIRNTLSIGSRVLQEDSIPRRCFQHVGGIIAIYIWDER